MKKSTKIKYLLPKLSIFSPNTVAELGKSYL
jgi:hypothetical protein